MSELYCYSCGMSDKSRIALIFGIPALLVIGGLYYYFKIHQPKQDRSKAADEILAWEARLGSVHRCLFGDKPASSRSAEALAVRELAPAEWDRVSCTKLIGKLSRGIAEDSGIMPVEHAWMSVDRAASRVANAFASHVDPGGEAPAKRGKDSPLPAALDELDAARAALREAAGMEPPPSAAPSALPAAEVIAVKHGSDRVATLTAWLIPSAGGAIAFGSIKGKGEVQLTLVPGAEPKVSKLPAGALRAVPDGSWGAAGLRQEVAIGTIDDKGAFAQMTSLPVEMGARVVIAVGSFTNGLVAYGASNKLVVARSQGAAFAADMLIDVGRLAFALDPSGRGLVAWSPMDEDGGLADAGKLQGFIAKDGALPKIVDLGSGFAVQACLTPTKGWVGGEDQFISFDDAGAVPRVFPEHELLGCSTDGALLHRYGSTHYAVCADQCRTADLTELRPTSIAAIAGGKVHAIRTRDKIIGVWSEGKPPRFYTTEKSVTATLAYGSGKTIELLGETEDGVTIVRLPL
jgi:hypothetical protein